MPSFFQPKKSKRTVARDGGASELGYRGASSIKRKRKPQQFAAIQLIVVLVALAAVGTAGYLLWDNSAQPSGPRVALPKIPTQDVAEGQTMTLRIAGTDDKKSSREIVYSITEGPKGAVIDPTSGEFNWTPGEADGPGEHSVVIRAAVGQRSAKCRFKVIVAEVNQPTLVTVGPSLTATAGKVAVSQVSEQEPDDPQVNFKTPPATLPETDVSTFVPPVETATSPVPATKPAVDKELEALLQLYTETQGRDRHRKLFDPASYKSLRGWFAQQFRREQAASFQEAWGAESEAMLAWLDQRLDFQEEFFTALDLKADDVAAALRLLQQLKGAFSEKIIDHYGNLVIAICVVWDRPSGLYHYKHHADRAKAAMPTNPADAIDCFRYLVEREKFMEGRILYVPWEYLTLVVNHQTPLEERDWALQAYGAQRQMFGKCYQDCPYDMKMLESESQFGALNGKPYNLATLRQFGGVCAHQADYASRVGKSMGIPAAYCGGAGRFGGSGHAWVMWVELKTVTASGISFTLESHGRYHDDNYYVGTLNDPQTGESITDRDLERRLNAVGVSTIGRRHAALAMRAWPAISDAQKPDFKAQLAYFSQVLKLSPWNEAAWKELAKVARENQDLNAADRKELHKAFRTLFTVFAGVPDFTVEVFNDLLCYETKPKTKIEYYYQLLDLYARAKRPDLSFKALPGLVELLVGNERKSEAVDMLAAVIKQNANEGQYIPAVVDDLERLCADDKKLQASLLAFYGEFVPLITQKRGNTVSRYCLDMHTRAMQRYQAAGETNAAELIRQRIAAIQSSGVPD